MPIKPSIAIIDDDEAGRDGLIAMLRSHDLLAKAFASADEFLNSHRLNLTTCVISDVKMPGMSGLELYGRLVVRGTPIPTILVTAYPDEQTRARALGAGVSAYLAKPFSGSELLDAIGLATGYNVLSTKR